MSDRDDLYRDPGEIDDHLVYNESEDEYARELQEFDAEPLRLVDKLLSLAPEKDPSRPVLYGLRRQLMEREMTFQEARHSLAELEVALEKVTSPSNRVAIYLGSPKDEIATVFVGGAEYYANIDPRVDVGDLEVGTRVLINEAYAVVGILGPNLAGPVVKIGDLFDDGRLRITQEHGTQDLVVERSAALVDLDLKKGDEVRLDPGFKVALERISAGNGKQYFLENVPVLDWSNIGGQEEAIKAIRDTIELPVLHPELFQRFQYSTPKGFLLYGPPGCGKTLIGKATAYNLVQHIRDEEGLDVREYFMHIKGPEILNMWLGETERMVREIFAQAREKRKEGFLPFVFIDEAESILGTRRSMRSHHIANTLVPMFCTEMDGIESLHDVVIILASNRHDLIDPAILRPGRIDRKIKVQRPDKAASQAIFEIYLTCDLPLDREEASAFENPKVARQILVDATVESFFSRDEETRLLEVTLRSGRVEVLHYCDLASGAIIDSIVQRGKETAVKRAIATEDPYAGLRREDLIQAMRSEFRESEVFPPTDSVEDWLKLLDYDPENVVRVIPVRSYEKTADSPGSKVI